MVEVREAVGGIQFLPFAGVYHAADALEVKDLGERNEGIRLEPEALHVIVPAGMLAEDADANMRLRLWGEQRSAVAQKCCREAAHA